MKTLFRISVGLNIIFAIYIILKGSQLFAQDILFDSKEENRVVTAEEIAATASSGECVTCDTVFTVQEYDLSTEKERIYQETLPESFIGMTREQLLAWIDEHSMNLTLEEMEQGLLSMELVSFSEKEIRIRKRVESEPEQILQEDEVQEPGRIYWSKQEESSVSQNSNADYGCILAQDGLLTVYDSQRRHVILYTDIPLFDLPQEQQQEILAGKYVQTEEELYHLLESYSS
nr:hypothetical protein [Lachnospiraceae bacterium]